MIIHSVRLKNIKSYGGGEEGLTVTFQRGVNRIAGRNGHGKSTLIEALGYGLFFAEPDFDEGFKLPTYFLRAGEKQGEIDVVFEHQGKVYRVERGVGQTRRRSKVVDVIDGSTCAMDDAEVQSCLCRLFGFKQQNQLRELFSNLLGVKQGALTRPFDSKPSAAREFFDPLLDVGIFRESTVRLSDSQKRFKELLDAQSIRRAGLSERIRLLAPSVDKIPQQERELETLANEVEKARKQKEQAEKAKQVCELKQKALEAARARLEEARNLHRLATQKRENDQQRANEAQEASEIVKRTQQDYQVYVQAEATLRLLHQQQKEKTLLLNQKADAANSKTESETLRAGAEKQVLDYQGQLEEKTRQVDTLTRQVESKKQCEDSKAEFEKIVSTTRAAKVAREKVDAWVERLPGQIEESRELLEDVLQRWQRVQKWDGQLLLKAKAEEQRLQHEAREWSARLAKAEEAKKNLADQLAQIAGGVCPFLKEKCRQFDPKAIRSDIAGRDKEIVEISRQEKKSTLVHERAKRQTEELLKQETELVHLRKTVEERVRALIQQLNEMFPSSIRNPLRVIESYLPDQTIPVESWIAIVPEDLWLVEKPILNEARLKELFDGRATFFQTLLEHLQKFGRVLDAKFRGFESDQAERVRQERDLANARQNIEQLKAELKAFTKKIDALRKEAGAAQAKTRQADARISELETKLKTFANLEQESRQQHELQDKNARNYQLYLGARPLAETVGQRRQFLEKSMGMETEAGQQLRKQAEAFESTQSDFDAAALERAREAANRAEILLAMNLSRFKAAETELKQSQERSRQWKEAEAEQGAVEKEIRRLQAASHLARVAGKVLKEAAPVVAQHLCSRIASRGQRIVNQINSDPVELEWKAEPQYSLRISPGERRFAMLSGGEQTKLALAMTLAMIEQFSGLKFAVFDEPTYGVDADSRQKLADAIIEAHRAAGLEQLILVSHDTAFDGKIEHVVTLNKRALGGTELVLSSL